MTTAVIADSRLGGTIAGPRHVPLVQHRNLRASLGLIALVCSAFVARAIHGGEVRGILIIAALAWLPAVWLTDKYTHKYPQRYFTYLISSHAKSAVVMALCMVGGWVALGGVSVSPIPLLIAFLVFVPVDFLLSAPRRTVRQIAEMRPAEAHPSAPEAAMETFLPLSREAVLRQIPPSVGEQYRKLLGEFLPDAGGEVGSVAVCNDAPSRGAQPGSVSVLIARKRINDARRLNRFFLACADQVAMGGYLVARYVPHDRIVERMRKNCPKWLYRPVYLAHFIWFRACPKIPWINAFYFAITNGRGRVLSKVEVWGRLSYCGMKVVAEMELEGETYLLAQRNGSAISRNKRPSYYPVVALEKVGLDGEIVRLHKVRSMYPFSEFLQKRIFEDNGLASTGKFANDFRLTEYGNFIRRYWIDELPQIWDWLRGDIKLVGMRATSRHYLSLYPQELYDLYVRIKPGLIPPIFDEKTDSFDRIVEVEMAYLTSYMKSPLRTDVGLFFKTFTDIIFRGVRSK